ncbi:MAG: DUF2142 domain-containing protein [Lachnospiraceae bacterium]
MTENKNHIIRRVLKWLGLFLLCILCAYGVEKYVLNAQQLSQTGINKKYELSKIEQTGFSYENGMLVSNQETSQVVLPAGGYIDEVKMEYEIADMAAIAWSTELQPDIKEIDLTNLWQCDCRAKIMEKPVQIEGEQLVLTFLNMPEPITIKSIALESNYVFHWQRFLMMVAGMMGIFIVLMEGKEIAKHPERAVAAICLLMGIALLGAVPYEKNSWDDETHFANAYRMSYAMIGQDTQWVEATDDFINIGLPFTDSYKERLNQEKRLDKAGMVETNVEKIKGIGYYLNKIDALPTAIGILIGRLSGVNFTDWFVGARMVNLLLYTIIIYFAIKIVPIGKGLMAFLSLLPTPLFLTVSYSTDYFMNSFMMLGFAVFLKEYLSPEEKLKKKNVAIFVAAMFFACIRKAIYIPLILIGLLIPKSKFESKKQKNGYRAIIIGCCVMVMMLVVFSASGMTDVRGGDTSVAGQISYILSNPISFAVMFVKEIVRYSIDYIFNGQGKTNYNIYGMRTGTVELVVIIFLIFLVLCSKGKEKEQEISLKTSILGLGLIGLVICFIWGSMYLSFTPVGSGNIEGVQSRHYIPFLFLLFMLLPLNKIKCYISEKIMMQGVLLMTVLTNIVCMYGLLIRP